MTRRIALATWSGLPELFEDDRILLHELRRRGIEATAAVWDAPGSDWGRFDAVVLRSTWDYHRRPTEFLEWAARCSRSTRLWNSLPTVRWNAHKSYLLELSRRGLPIVPTEVARAGDTLADIRRRTGWSKLVVKPAVSANADGSYLVGPDDLVAFEPRFQEALRHAEQLVQPFIEGVLTSGERSLVYLGGRFSHAFRKGPVFPVDLRKEIGNPSVPATAVERSLAEQVIATRREVPLYARVDLVEGADGRPVLMELELIEPLLGFSVAPQVAPRFADELEARLGSM